MQQPFIRVYGCGGKEGDRMTFSSTLFIFLYLPLALLIYWKTPHIYRTAVLFLLSFFAYCWAEPVYGPLLLLLVIFIYRMCRRMEKSSGHERKLLAAEITAAAVFLLSYFKYYGFIVSTAGNIAGIRITGDFFPVPAAISFITFTLISYCIDVYRGDCRTGRFLEFAAYIFFFPKIMMGPIMNFGDFYRKNKRNLTFRDGAEGLERFVTGLAKKVVLADTFAMIFTQMSQVEHPSAMTAWLCALAFTFQIYFDFSGYSDMAAGTAILFGFRIPENFNYPYTAAGIKDFWSRWHISLSMWFRRYVYIPLGGSRCSSRRTLFNTFAVWALTGLWHGASWNFVLWGMYYFVLLTAERYIRKRKEIMLPKWMKQTVTFILVIFGWVLFSYTDFGAMADHITAMFGRNGFTDSQFFWYLSNYGLFFAAGLVLSAPVYRYVSGLCERAGKMIYIKYAFLVCIAFTAVAFLVSSTFQPFLYAQF